MTDSELTVKEIIRDLARSLLRDVDRDDADIHTLIERTRQVAELAKEEMKQVKEAAA